MVAGLVSVVAWLCYAAIAAWDLRHDTLGGTAVPAAVDACSSFCLMVAVIADWRAWRAQPPRPKPGWRRVALRWAILIGGLAVIIATDHRFGALLRARPWIGDAARSCFGVLAAGLVVRQRAASRPGIAGVWRAPRS